MERPGRNEPCYCGSGKKYKQCHMAADLAADSEQRVWAEASRELRSALLDFAEEERFDNDAGHAAAYFWNDLYTADSLHMMSAAEEERFHDWFLFDYTLPDANRRPVELYRDDRGARLPAAQRELLDQWAGGAPMGGYELTGYDRQILQLKEIVSGEELELYEPAGPGNAPLGAVILGRPIFVRDHYEFFSMSAYIPPEEIADLPAKLAEARVAGDSSGDGWLRRHNVLLIHHALDQATSAGRPPVARLDPRHTPESVRRRARHERVRIKGPAGMAENAPPMMQSHRKAI